MNCASIPAIVVRKVPQLRDYKFVKLDDRILVVRRRQPQGRGGDPALQLHDAAERRLEGDQIRAVRGLLSLFQLARLSAMISSSCVAD